MPTGDKEKGINWNISLYIYDVSVVELYIVLLNSKFYLQISHIGTRKRE